MPVYKTKEIVGPAMNKSQELLIRLLLLQLDVAAPGERL